jgi:hypothetical protein
MSVPSEQSKKIKVALSANGLVNVPRNVYKNDFTFIVGDSRYECPSVFAAFISPRIGSLQRNDATIDEFEIETKDPRHYFSHIVDLCSGLTISIDFANSEVVRFLVEICGELRNRELYEKIFGGIESELTISNVFDRLRFLDGIGENCETELSFCSSHLFEIDKSVICSLPFDLFSGIVSDVSIQLKDEDSFYGMIRE